MVAVSRQIEATNGEIDRSVYAMLRAALSFDAELGEGEDCGQRYVIDLEVTGPTGTALVRSAWIVRHDEDFPRFVSCYVL